MVDTFTEENMKTLIKEIFQEEFKNQAENITNLICGNFKLTMQEIYGLKNEVNDLRKSLEFTQNKLEEKVDNIEKRMEKLVSDIQENYEYQIDPKYVQDKLTELEDRSRRNNIRIDGIKEAKGETWNDCEEKVQDMFAQKLGLDGIEIELAHRVKRNNRDSNTDRPRTIVVKLLRFKDKTKIFPNANKLKEQNIFINNNFSKATLELRKDLMVEVKRLRELGKIAYLNYTTIVSREKVEE